MHQEPGVLGSGKTKEGNAGDRWGPLKTLDACLALPNWGSPRKMLPRLPGVRREDDHAGCPLLGLQGTARFPVTLDDAVPSLGCSLPCPGGERVETVMVYTLPPLDCLFTQNFPGNLTDRREVEGPLEAQKVVGAMTEEMSAAPPGLGWCGAPACPSDVTLSMSGGFASSWLRTRLIPRLSADLWRPSAGTSCAEVGAGGGMMGLRHCCQTHLGEGEKKQDTQT